MCVCVCGINISYEWIHIFRYIIIDMMNVYIHFRVSIPTPEAASGALLGKYQDSRLM